MGKVVLFIVEGATDKQTLASIFRKIYRNRTVRSEFTHGDIASDETMSVKNVEDKIYKCVRSYIDISKIRKSDIWQIVQISGMDGAHTDDPRIVGGGTRGFFYTEKEVSYKNHGKISLRNKHKKELMEYLLSLQGIKGIPYEGHYMSCSLDHTLYGLMNLSDEERKEQADSFYLTFWEHSELFLPFPEKHVVNDVPDSFPASWTYIKGDNHSLERHTDLHIYFSEHPAL